MMTFDDEKGFLQHKLIFDFLYHSRVNMNESKKSCMYPKLLDMHFTNSKIKSKRTEWKGSQIKSKYSQQPTEMKIHNSH